MANRFRNERIEIKLTKEEKEVFEKKMKLANCKTMSHFLRKCVLEKEIYVVDLEPFRDLQWLLSNATNNINQIAKATNTTGVIYKNEIESMNNHIEKLSKEIWQIHSLLQQPYQRSNHQYTYFHWDILTTMILDMNLLLCPRLFTHSLSLSPDFLFYLRFFLLLLLIFYNLSHFFNL